MTRTHEIRKKKKPKEQPRQMMKLVHISSEWKMETKKLLVCGKNSETFRLSNTRKCITDLTLSSTNTQVSNSSYFHVIFTRRVFIRRGNDRWSKEIGRLGTPWRKQWSESSQLEGMSTWTNKIIVQNEKLDLALIKKKDGATLYITRDIAAAHDRWQRFHFQKMYYVVRTPRYVVDLN